MNDKKKVKEWLIDQVSRRTNLPAESIDSAKPLRTYRIYAKAFQELTKGLEELTGDCYYNTLFYDYPTIDAIADYVVGKKTCQQSEKKETDFSESREEIAVVGMACRFPGGCNSPDQLWEFLSQGRDGITEVPENRWDAQAYYDPNPKAQGKATTCFGGFLENIEMFDAAHFGITPREAKAMDVQQRIALEVCWEALEDAAELGATLNNSRTGVFLGVSLNDYTRNALNCLDEIDFYHAPNSYNSLVANRISYTFGLQGPSLAIDTACSSSLVSVHAACQSLLAGECNLALCGGVAAMTSPEITVAFSKGNLMATVILITSELLDAPPMPDLPQKNDPDDTAYVIYTSGSTGMPKGVVITHRGAVNTLLDVCNRFNITREDKVLALSALNFDLSVFDLFGLLSVGGSVIIPHVEKVKDPAHWWQLLQMHKITIWNSVPVLMEMLLDTPHEENPEYLRLVMLSGDWIPVSLPDAVMETFHNPQVISLGGATEASIWSVLYPIDKVEANWTSIPYGRAMENQTIYVLKDDLSQCPVWMTGELYIGGIGLAKGYWRDQEKTEKSFINHPKTGERLYRTGDYGRMRPDGNIEFQGRADSQVKIHGNRVELGEIENAIRSHEGIRDSAVEVIKEEGVDKIQAFLVPFPSSANQTLYTQEICKEEQMAKIHSELAKAAKQNAMSVSESALHDYPAYWEFMGRLADAVIANILLDMGVYQSDSDSYSLEEMIEHCEIDSQHQPMFAKWMERLCERKILEFVDGRYKQIEPIDPDILSDTLLTLLPVGSYWYSKAEQLLHYFQDIISIYPEMLHGEIDPRELLLDEDAPLTAKAMEQFDSLEEQVKNMLVSIVEQAMENIESETVTIMELGSLSGNLADTIVPNMDKEKYRYCYTHVSTVFLDEVRDALERPEDVEYQIYNFNAAPSTQGLQLHSVDILIAPNTLHRARNLALTLEHLKTLLKPGGIFFLYEETVNNPIQFITVGLFEKGFTEFTDERKTTFESLLSRERWTHEVEHAGMQVLGCYPQTDEETSIFGHSVFIIQGPVAVQRFDETKLEHYLREHLPNYMIPNAYCLLDKIPITENGKVSRKQLRQMVNHSLQTNWQGYCGPETDLEREISEIWKGVLGTKRDDVNEDFITLGGDSLQAVQLVNQIKKRYQLDFPLNRMFQNVTIRVLSAFVENGIKNKDVE